MFLARLVNTAAAIPKCRNKIFNVLKSNSKGNLQKSLLCYTQDGVSQFHSSITPFFTETCIAFNAQTPLTSESHPHLKRDDSFEKLQDTHVEYFKTFLEENQIIYNKPDEIEPFNVDWTGKYRGQSRLILKPKTTNQVSSILKYCQEKRLAVVPQGGNTGLVGGSVPVFDEIILNLANLNNVRSFEAVSGIIVAESGCILETLNHYLQPHGYIMPIDLGAKGSCQIGGNLATNAGGLRFLRYGSLHGSTLGLEVVLPDGTILDNLATLRKDNTGYDIKQLFIGSEGTIGVITAAAIVTPQAPKVVNVAFVGVESYEAVQKAFALTKQNLSEVLSAFEFIDDESMQLVKLHGGLRDPLSSSFPFYVLIETHGSNKDHDDEKLSSLLEILMEEDIVQDGVVAQDETQIQNLWKYREFVPEAVSKHGKTYKYDLSVPLPQLYNVVERTREHLIKQGVFDPNNQDQNLIRAVTGYGHVGDCNLHLNVVATEVSPRVAKTLEPFVYELTAEYNGSISAEHGLGLQKANYLKYSKSDTMISMMQKMKQSFDPEGIMNPYKFLPKAK